METLTPEELKNLDPCSFRYRVLNEKEILELFEICDAVWIHDGDPKSPHAELTSGMCSNGYFNCSNVLKYPNICEILAYQLFRKIVWQLKENGGVDWVVGSPYAAITFSYEIAKYFRAVHGFCEKSPIDSKKMVWRRDTIPASANVLQIEELITTGSTLRKIREAVTLGNPNPVKFLPIVGTLVHRPPDLSVRYEINGQKIKVVSLIEKEIWAKDPSECPLCRAGSKRYRPKTHWKELTQK